MIRRSPACPTESREQLLLVEWLRWQKFTFAHIPNGSRRSARQGAQLKREGMSAGVPDLLIFDPPPGIYAHHRGVAIELKRQRGGTVSPAQREWIDKLTACGWYAVVCRGADEAITHISTIYGRQAA